MSTQAIPESGMIFGPYPEGQCFHIERSECYSQVQEGVQMAEFLLLRHSEGVAPCVWVVEAKSSCPRKLDGYMEDIRAKLTNGFLLGLAACLGRHPAASEELPQAFKALDARETTFRFVLVVNGVPDEYLPELQSSLALKLRPLLKTWALPPVSVAVLNPGRAQKHGLIQPSAPAAP